VICSETPQKLYTAQNAWVICENGFSAGVFRELPERYRNLPVYDYGDSLILPGLIDLHLHAPQYPNRALGMDLELLEWLRLVAFPEEARYADLAYAERAYTRFAEDLKKSATTRACVYATIHTPATERLMEILDETGLDVFVGRVNMDRNAPEDLCEKDAQTSLAETERWISDSVGRYRNVRPILTPRFLPSCSDELMEGLGALQKKYKLPVQSHLSENTSEVAWVKKLAPDAVSYGHAYDRFGLFGGGYPAIMAHCVYSTPEEVDLMERRGVFVAHCPQSNTNLASGVAPVRRYLDRGLPMGFGTDVSGGHSLSVFRTAEEAISVSKLRWRLLDPTLSPITVPEAFYLATKGGGAFFGKVGGFGEGFLFDALVVDDSRMAAGRELSLFERLEKVVFLSDDRDIRAKFVNGSCIFSEREQTRAD
jgi:guanine deaminase